MEREGQTTNYKTERMVISSSGKWRSEKGDEFKRLGGLWFVTISDAGHMVFCDELELAAWLAESWIGVRAN